MLIDIDIYRIFSLALDATFTGFCVSMFLAFSLKFSLPYFSKNYIKYSIEVIRILALAYLFFQIIYLTHYFTSADYSTFSNRASGPYAWAYWYMLFRPLIYCSITQLFWINHIRIKNSSILYLLFLIFPLTIFSGRVLEKLIIIIITFHRDYLPYSWTSFPSYNILTIALLNLVEKTILYIILVLGTWFISKKINTLKT